MHRLEPPDPRRRVLGARPAARHEGPDDLARSARLGAGLRDGTVPSFSALPPEMDGHVHSPIRLVERHGPLAHTHAIVEIVRQQLTRQPPTRVHGPEGGRRPTLGLDLDEVHPAGVPIRLGAAPRQVGADVSGHPVWAQLRPVAGRGRVDVRLGWDAESGGFCGEFPGQAPGLYEVGVSAREVPSAGDLGATDTVAVVEGD